VVVRLFTICLYLTFVYWASSHISVDNVLFYPTLGAFSYFFVSRSMSKAESLKTILAAVIGVTCGSRLHMLSAGIITFLITCLIAIALLRILKIHAAPVVAVSLIPFFSKTPSFWVLPVSVLCSLSGLLLVLWGSQLVEARWITWKEKARLYPSVRGKSFEETL